MNQEYQLVYAVRSAVYSLYSPIDPILLIFPRDRHVCYYYYLLLPATNYKHYIYIAIAVTQLNTVSTNI